MRSRLLFLVLIVPSALVGAVCFANGTSKPATRSLRPDRTRVPIAVNRHRGVRAPRTRAERKARPGNRRGNASRRERASLATFFWLAARAFGRGDHKLAYAHAGRALEFDALHLGAWTLRDASREIGRWESPDDVHTDRWRAAYRDRDLVVVILVWLGVQSYRDREYARAERIAERALRWVPDDKKAIRLREHARRARVGGTRELMEGLEQEWKKTMRAAGTRVGTPAVFLER